MEVIHFIYTKGVGEIADEMPWIKATTQQQRTETSAGMQRKQDETPPWVMAAQRPSAVTLSENKPVLGPTEGELAPKLADQTTPGSKKRPRDEHDFFF